MSAPASRPEFPGQGLRQDAPHGAWLLGSSAPSARLRAQIERIAGTPGTTLFLAGPAGMPSLAVARAIHDRSDAQGFVALHAASPGELLASPPNAGEASRDTWWAGTLFLEDVGLLDERGQTLLLRHLDQAQGTARRARVIASSTIDLEAHAQEGRFLPDLLYRLNVLTLHVPPLAERRKDVPSIALGLATHLRARLGLPCELTSETLERLTEHHWPGDALELESLLSLACLRAGQAPVTPQSLAALGLDGTEGAPPSPLVGVEAAPAALPRSSTLRELEANAIRRVLADEDGNRSRAARALGIHRQTLYNKMRLYGIR